MVIDSVKKKAKHIEVTIGSEVILLEPELYYRYHLSTGQDVDEETLQTIRHENQQLYFYRLAIEKLKKPLTSFEMKNFLMKESAPMDIVMEIISKLTERKYIDDLAYAHMYVESKKFVYGPEKMREELQRKGISQDDIQDVIKTIREQEILKKLVPSKMKSMTNKSKKAMMASVRTYFLSKGYTMELIESTILHNLSAYQGDDQKLLEQAYDKLLAKYQKHLSGYALTQTLMQKLYQKGFKMEDIRNIMQHHQDA